MRGRWAPVLGLNALTCPPVLPVLPCLALSCLVMSCRSLPCLILSCLVLSYLGSTWLLGFACLVLVLSWLLLSCLVLACLVLSCLALSCLALPFLCRAKRAGNTWALRLFSSVSRFLKSRFCWYLQPTTERINDKSQRDHYRQTNQSQRILMTHDNVPQHENSCLVFSLQRLSLCQEMKQ